MALFKFKYHGKTVLSPKYDKVFKAMFLGKDKTLLVSFLSSILGMEIEADGIIVIKAEFVGNDKDDKAVFLDMLVQLKDGSRVNVEMQVDNEHNMGRRS